MPPNYQNLGNVSIDPPSLNGFSSETSGVFLDADGTNSSLLIRTDNTHAVYVDKYQNMGINTTSPNSQLDVNSSTGDCLQLTRDGSNSNKANFTVNSSGNLSMSAGGGTISIATGNSLDIVDHDGVTGGLKLGGTLLTATATQLNSIVSGTGSNTFSSADITGNLTLSNHDGSTTGLILGSTLVTSTANELNYLSGLTTGTASASKALVLDSDSSISSINSLSSTKLLLQGTSIPELLSTWTPQTSIASNTWKAIAYSPSLDIYVAIANNNANANSFASSTDGLTWTARSASAIKVWNDVIWVEDFKMFVAVSNATSTVNFSFSYSTNGTTWTAINAPAALNFTSIYYAKETRTFIASSGYGSVNTDVFYYTSNFTGSWSLAKATFMYSYVRMIYQPKLKQYLIMRTGTTTTSGGGTFFEYGTGLRSSNTFETRSYGNIATTVSTKTWMDMADSPELGVTVAVASDLTSATDSVVYSTNASIWTLTPAASAASWFKVIWAAEVGMFVAISSDSTPQMMRSYNGINWTSVTLPNNLTVLSDIRWFPEKSSFLLVSSASGSSYAITLTSITSSSSLTFIKNPQSASLKSYITGDGMLNLNAGLNGTLRVLNSLSTTNLNNEIMRVSTTGLSINSDQSSSAALDIGAISLNNNKVLRLKSSSGNHCFDFDLDTSGNLTTSLSVGLTTAITMNHPLKIGNSQYIESTNTGTGQLIVHGGIGINGSMYVGGTINPTAINIVNTTLSAGLGSSFWNVDELNSLYGITGGSVPSRTVNNIVWSPQLKILVATTGSLGIFLYSYDGLAWSTSSSGITRTFDGVCWADKLGLFIAIANDTGTNTGMIATSPDGITWTSRNGPPTPGTYWRSIAWSPQLNLVVACAGVGTQTAWIMSSSNGIDWTLQTTPSSSQSNANFRKIIWNPTLGHFVACGYGQFAVSTNGTTWTLYSTSTTTYQFQSLDYSPVLGMYVASHINNSSWGARSTDGITWTTATVSPYADIVWVPRHRFFLGSAGDSVSYDEYSINGTSWTTLNRSLKDSGYTNNKICYSPDLELLFIARTGNSSANRNIIISKHINKNAFNLGRANFFTRDNSYSIKLDSNINYTSGFYGGHRWYNAITTNKSGDNLLMALESNGLAIGRTTPEAKLDIQVPSNGEVIRLRSSEYNTASIGIDSSSRLTTTSAIVNGDLSIVGPVLSIPTGNTAARPSVPSLGYIRYNSETSQFEGFGAGNSWGSLGGVTDVNQDTKILAEDGAGTNDDNLRFFNNGSENMRLTSTGLLGLGTNAPDKKLEINSSTGDCLRLTYNDSNGSATNYTDLLVSSGGDLSLTPSGGSVDITTHDGTTQGLKLGGVLLTATATQLNSIVSGSGASSFSSATVTGNLTLSSHDGATSGLILGSTLVTATGTELNYLDTTPGTAQASKALVLDSSSNLTGISSLTMSTKTISPLYEVIENIQESASLNTSGLTSMTNTDPFATGSGYQAAGGAYSPTLDMFVISKFVSQTNSTMTSTDGGVTWSFRTKPNVGFNYIAQSIKWFGGSVNKFIMANQAYATTRTYPVVIYSSDGITWTAANYTTTSVTIGVVPMGMARNSSTGRIVIASMSNNGTNSGAITYSDDGGLNWTTTSPVFTGTPAYEGFTDILYNSNAGIFVASHSYSTNTGNRISTSTDGINWTVRTTDTAVPYAKLLCNPTTNVVLAIPNAYIGTSTDIIRSTDGGVTWTTITIFGSATGIDKVLFVPDLGLFMLFKQTYGGPTMFYSSTGLTWTSVSTNFTNLMLENFYYDTSPAYSPITGRIVLTTMHYVFAGSLLNPAINVTTYANLATTSSNYLIQGTTSGVKWYTGSTSKTSLGTQQLDLSTTGLNILTATNATSTTTGALKTSGGLGIALNAHIGGSFRGYSTGRFDDTLTVYKNGGSGNAVAAAQILRNSYSSAASAGLGVGTDYWFPDSTGGQSYGGSLNCVVVQPASASFSNRFDFLLYNSGSTVTAASITPSGLTCGTLTTSSTNTFTITNNSASDYALLIQNNNNAGTNLTAGIRFRHKNSANNYFNSAGILPYGITNTAGSENTGIRFYNVRSGTYYDSFSVLATGGCQTKISGGGTIYSFSMETLGNNGYGDLAVEANNSTLLRLRTTYQTTGNKSVVDFYNRYEGNDGSYSALTITPTGSNGGDLSNINNVIVKGGFDNYSTGNANYNSFGNSRFYYASIFARQWRVYQANCLTYARYANSGMPSNIFSQPDNYTAEISGGDFSSTIRSFGSQFCFEIEGYLNPEYTETYTFTFDSAYVKFRIWLDGKLVAQNWSGAASSSATATVSCTANKKISFYAQVQATEDTTTNNNVFTVKWQSTTRSLQLIPSTKMEATITGQVVNRNRYSVANQLTLYETSSNATSAVKSELTIDTSGNTLIKSSGTLVSIDSSNSFDVASHNGATVGLKLGGTLVTSTATELNYVDVTPGTASATKALVLDADKDIVDIRDITSRKLTLSGITGDVSLLSSGWIQGDLIISQKTGSGFSHKSDSSGTKEIITYIDASDAKVNFIGTYTNNAFGIASNNTIALLADTTGFIGVGTNAPDKQLEINSSTGDCLRLTYNDNNGSATNYADFSVSNSGNLTIKTSGTLVTLDSTNSIDIASHDGSTVGLKLGGTLVTSTADELNYVDVTPGTASASKALVLDSSSDITGINALTATELTGELQTASQPNITSVGTLTSLDVSGAVSLTGTTASTSDSTGVLTLAGGIGISNTTDATSNTNGGSFTTAGGASFAKSVFVGQNLTIGGNLLVSGTTTTVNTTTTTINDNTLVLNSGPAGSGYDAGVLTGRYQTSNDAGTGDVVTDTEKALFVLDSATSTTIVLPNTASAVNDYYKNWWIKVVDGSGIDQVRKITAYDGSTFTATIGSAFTTTPSTSDSVKLYNKGYTSFIWQEANKRFAAAFTTQDEPAGSPINIVDHANFAVNKLISLDTTASTSNSTGGLILSGGIAISKNTDATSSTNGGSLTSAGGAAFAKTVYVGDALRATDVYGTLQTASQPNVTSVTTLDITGHDGSTAGLALDGTLVTSTGLELNYVSGLTIGTASASKALVLDSSSDIAGINSLSSTSVLVGSPANTDLPLEVGTVSYTFTGAYAYTNSNNAHGVVAAGNGVQANYSLRADGRVLVTGEIEVTSDLRLKKDIIPLTLDFCKSFITKTKPVQFNWKNGDEKTEYGYIAQDVYKAGFTDVVNISSSPGMEEIVEEDGFINPKDAKFTLSTGKIIPILACNQKDLIEQNEEQAKKIKSLEERIALLESAIARLTSV